MIYPLQHEFPYMDPLTIVGHFAGRPGLVFLDSATLRDGCGRYSFIAVDPFQTLTSKQGHVRLGDERRDVDPFILLDAELRRFPLDSLPDRPPFQGGVAGFFSYDLCQHLENVPVAHDDMGFPDLAVGFYDLVMAFDHARQRAWIFSSGYPAAARLSHAEERLQWLLAELANVKALMPVSDAVCDVNAIEANFSRETYQHAVQAVIDYILAGDIFEANISQRFRALLPEGLTPFDLYRRLRHGNPAPFAAYVALTDMVLASASPERFIQLRERALETRPIKGTRRRGATPAEDQQLATELQTSEKDRAENVMIVDLLRNDLSRVCRDHTVRVPQLCGLESYATVHHLVSVVTGELTDGLQAVDVLRAAFPGGSITGAPKVRSMEIIAELEPTQRGPYCGSIGYIGFHGDMDTSITIRTFAMRNGHVTFQAGGAVVADSCPQAEYEETLVKARALRTALTQAIT